MLETYDLAVKLSTACNSSATPRDGLPVCHACSSSTSTICCLECDFTGCLTHKSHEHALGAVVGPDLECSVYCFHCRDLQVSKKFEARRLACMRAILHTRAVPAKLSPKTKQSFTAFTGLRGFINLGSTCYASVVLQSLVHNPLVKTFYLAGGHRREACRRTNCLSCSVDRVYTDFYGSNSVTGYGITDLLVALSEKQPVMGAGSTEQDAHEFYLLLLSEFHKNHLSSPTFKKSDAPEQCGCITHRHFSGTLCSTLSCECGAKTSKEEPMVDLGLDVGQQAQTTLKACLERFTSGELVSNYTCEQCSQTKTTTKKLLLSSLPPVLMIQLKRFKIFASGGSSKIESPVDFDLQIDLAPFTVHAGGTPLVYELFGVICHTGSLDTGHYTCVMKHSLGVWYHFDDSMVRRVNIDFVKQTRTAYLLLYVVKSAM